MSGLVQSSSGKSVGASSIAITLGGVNSANQLVLIYQGNAVPSATPTGFVSDYAPALNGAVNSFFYRNATPSAGSNTVTLNFGGGMFGFAVLAEVAGIQAAALDKTATTNVAASASVTQQACSVTTAALSSASEILFGAFSFGTGGGVVNSSITDPPAKFTSLFVDQNSNADRAGEVCVQQVTSAAAVTALWNFTDTSGASTGAQGNLVSYQLPAIIVAGPAINLLGQVLT